MAEIDRLESESKTAKPAEPKKESPKPAATDKKSDDTVKPVTDQPEKKDEPSKVEEKPFKAADLRAAYEKLKGEHKALKTEFEKVKTTKPPEDEEKPKLIQLLSDKDKRIAELEESVRYLNYESGDEYKEKYEKPFIDAFQAGRARTASLKVTNSDGDVRKGGPEDFDAIMMITDDDAAAEKAAEMFGAKAPLVLYHRERVRELHDSRVKAIEDYRKNRTEKEKAAFEMSAKQRAESESKRVELAKTFHSLNQQAAQKYPKWFAPVEGDDEGNALLEKGFKLVDAAFVDSNGNIPPERIVQLHSAIRNKAGAFDRLAHQFSKAQSRISELETELKQFKESGPGAGGDTGKQKVSQEVSAEDEIDAMDKASRR